MSNKIDKFSGENRFLSNFYTTPIVYEGHEYRSTEHAYQAAKTLDESWKRKIREAEKASETKKLGKQCPMRPDWNEVRIGVMTDLVRIKFSKSPLKEKLLMTGDAELIEGNFWGDVFWGVCKGRGENYLGKILMQIRDELNHGTKLTAK